MEPPVRLQRSSPLFGLHSSHRFISSAFFSISGQSSIQLIRSQDSRIKRINELRFQSTFHFRSALTWKIFVMVKFVLLGAVPFRSDVYRLKDLGVGAVVTLNEPYETLVPTSLYQAHGIYNLVLPTRDYLFAPSLNDICQAVDFIHENASYGRSTYVHCKAGRGRSTTIVVCYLVKYKQMKPDVAYDYVKSIRPRVLLASSQWQAVEEFYDLKVKKTCTSSPRTSLVFKSPKLFTGQDLLAFDDGSVVIITKGDLDGYEANQESGTSRNEIWADFSLIYRVRVTGKTALAKLSCMWFRCHTPQKVLVEEMAGESSCLIGAEELDGFTLDIHVYSS